MIFYGDCLDVMAEMEADSIDLIVTSPPYADARKHTYGGVDPDDYNEWFLPRAEQIKRVMKPTGSFIVNIKEMCLDGERHLYVLDLITALKREVGLRWVEEYIWHKKNAMPIMPRYRLKDAWERLLHFSKTRDFKFRPDAVMAPTLEVSIKRAARMTEQEKNGRRCSQTQSGFGIKQTNLVGREQSYPSNVLYQASVCHNKGHSAAFPDSIPEFFIRLFTDEGDTVLDPFLGSGTTYKVAEKLARKAVGIEILEEYAHLHQPDQQLRLI